MVDINFIKWMCEKVEHYQVSDSDFILSISDGIELCELPELQIDYPVNYRDIIQEAIEKIEVEKSISFRTEKSIHYSTEGWIWKCGNIGQSGFSGRQPAKESALRFIYEQETK